MLWLDLVNFCINVLNVLANFALDIYDLLLVEVSMPFDLGSYPLYEGIFIVFGLTLVVRFIAQILNPVD